MAEEYTQYTFNLPGGEQSIQTALSLDDAKQKALDWYRSNGYSAPDLSNFTEKPAGADYYIATRKPVPSGVPLGGQNVQRNTQMLESQGFTVENGMVTKAPIMAPTGPVEQKQEAPQAPVGHPAAKPPGVDPGTLPRPRPDYLLPENLHPTPAETVLNQTEDVFQPVSYTPAAATQPAVSNYTPAMDPGPRAGLNPYMAAAPNIQPMAARPNVQMPPLPQFAAPQPSGMGIMGQLPSATAPGSSPLQAPSNAFSKDYAGFLTQRN